MNYAFETTDDIVTALNCRGDEQERLFARARIVREEHFGNRVEVRSVIEYANLCQQECHYCGMHKGSPIRRYILSDEEFLTEVDVLYGRNRRVLMVQTGECVVDTYFHTLFELLKTIKGKYPELVVIASLGNLPENHYRMLRSIGVDRYLMKFETSDPRLYHHIKPSDTLENRLAQLHLLKKMGFQISSGNITGLPGQSLESIAADLLLLRELGVAMGSSSVFIPNDRSDFAGYPAGDINCTLNFMAILRILCPQILIPTTSSMELVCKDGQYKGLMAGANTVTLHDGTPGDKEDQFVIYRQDRYKPKSAIFDIVERAHLVPAMAPLI